MSVSVRLLQGDCRRAMALMSRKGVTFDSIVTDPPYHLTSIVKRFGADGSGTTGIAAMAEGMRCVLVEAEPEYCADIRARLDHAEGRAGHSTGVRQRHADNPAGAEGTPLFSEAAE